MFHDGVPTNSCEADAPEWSLNPSFLRSVPSDHLRGVDRGMDFRLKEYNDGVRTESQWDLHRIVLRLRTLRGQWRQNTKPDGVSCELPSQEAPSDVLEGLSAALFPRHFGPPSLNGEGVDYYIGSTRDGALQSLLEQVRRDLKVASGLPDNGRARREQQAIKITRDLAQIRQRCWAAAAGRGVTWPLRSRSLRPRS
jgi:hypothetical protein